MVTLTEARRTGEFLMSTSNFHLSHDTAVIAPSQTIRPGMVLARLPLLSTVSAVAAPGIGNTAGSGALTLADPAVSSKVKDGVYQVLCIEPATDGGTFEVFDPAGVSIGRARVGVAFSKEVKFTIADATDFVAGDRFTITIAANDYLYVRYDPAATDGSEIAAAVALAGVVTPADATARIDVVGRGAEVNGRTLEWPSGITAGQKADAVQSLERFGIVVRS